MDGLSSYVFSVICASVIGGLLSALLPKEGAAAAVTRFSAGVYLILTIIQPLARFNYSALEHYLEMELPSIGNPAEEGKELAWQETAAIIRTQTEAYILDKAQALGSKLEVEIEVGGEAVPIPMAAVIRGNVPPDVKLQLEAVFVNDLGIQKENLKWIGVP